MLIILVFETEVSINFKNIQLWTETIVTLYKIEKKTVASGFLRPDVSKLNHIMCALQMLYKIKKTVPSG